MSNISLCSKTHPTLYHTLAAHSVFEETRSRIMRTFRAPAERWTLRCSEAAVLTRRLIDRVDVSSISYSAADQRRTAQHWRCRLLSQCTAAARRGASAAITSPTDSDTGPVASIAAADSLTAGRREADCSSGRRRRRALMDCLSDAVPAGVTHICCRTCREHLTTSLDG